MKPRWTSILACALLLCLPILASDELPLPIPVVNISAVEVSRGAERPQGLQMEATAYTATGNRTCTGTWPQEGRTVATDPAVIPHGSRLIIDGQPGYVAEDSGSAVQGRIIDIYMDQTDRCLDWGRRQVEVIVE